MMQRSARLRKEYLYRKNVSSLQIELKNKRRKLQEALEYGRRVPTDLRGVEGSNILQILDLYDGASNCHITQHEDDEYSLAGVNDPKVIITTSRDPSTRLINFVKELKLIIPGSERMNRGGYVLKDLVHLCTAHNVTDLVLVHEHRGQPNGLVICHLPHGPTAYFQLSEVILRHDLPEKPPNMSQQPPHLIFHDFSSKLGARVSNILKYLYPPSPVSTSRRIQAYVNIDDTVQFRHYTYAQESSKVTNLSTNSDKKEDNVEISEQGPRFSLKPYKIELGTLDMKDLPVEWAIRSFLNSTKKLLT